MQGTAHTETSKQDRSQGVVRALVRASGQEAREKSSQDKVRQTGARSCRTLEIMVRSVTFLFFFKCNEKPSEK